MTDIWLPTLMVDTPQAGFDLAVKLSRVGVCPSSEHLAQLAA